MGYVHLINKNRTIDISNTLKNYKFNDNFTPNLFEKFQYTNSGIFNAFQGVLSDFFNPIYNDNDLEPYKQELVALCSKLDKSMGNSIHFLEQYIEYLENDKDVYEIYKQYFPDMELGGYTLRINFYTGLLRLYFQDLSTLHFYSRKEWNYEFPPIPYFIYRTPYKFDRIKSQDGVFIYQGFINYNFPNEGQYDGMIVQKINPDITLQINNQAEILKDLDWMGINKKSLFGDFDSIAEYINAKVFDYI